MGLRAVNGMTPRELCAMPQGTKGPQGPPERGSWSSPGAFPVSGGWGKSFQGNLIPESGSCTVPPGIPVPDSGLSGFPVGLSRWWLPRSGLFPSMLPPNTAMLHPLLPRWRQRLVIPGQQRVWATSPLLWLSGRPRRGEPALEFGVRNPPPPSWHSGRGPLCRTPWRSVASVAR